MRLLLGVGLVAALLAGNFHRDEAFAAPKPAAAQSEPAGKKPKPPAAQSEPAGKKPKPAAKKSKPAAKKSKPAAKKKSKWRLTGSFKIKTRVLLVVNALYGTRRAVPGGYALYMVVPAIGGDQFQITPSDTTLGFSLSGVSFGDVKLGGSLDINLKTPTPLISANILAPQFYDAFVSAESEHLILRFGKFPDVILPFVVPSTNGFPGSYFPGQIGYTRAQLRADWRLPFGDRWQLLVQGALSRPVQTFQITGEVVAGGAGLPDLQGRVALAAGEPVDEDDPWKRRYELGIAGHWGRRDAAALGAGPAEIRTFTTWSIGADLRAAFPTGTTLELRIWRGAVLGDYTGGVFQTVSTELLDPVAAYGYLAVVRQDLRGGWQINAGFGRDDPDDADVGPGERTLNEAGFANVFWNWSKMVGFAFEASRWQTDYKEQGSTRSWRGELLTILRYY